MTLVIKNDGIGDLVLASGLIADLAQQRGPVDLLTCAANREVAENIPGLRRLLLVSRDAIHFQPHLLRLGIRWLRCAPEDRVVLEHLESTPYDTAICLRRFVRQSSLALMQRVKATAKHCAWLYPTNAPAPMAQELSQGWEHYRGSEAGSELVYYREFLRQALSLVSTAPPSLRCAEGVVPAPEPGRVGLVIAGASTNWPSEHWLQLARALANAGKMLVLFGGPDARHLAQQMKSVVPNVGDFTGRLSLADAVPELRRLELLIANDTGFTHFASLCTARVLVILGGGTFGRFFPWPDTRNQHLLFRAMACYDCDWSCHLPQRDCLEQIRPEDVLNWIPSVMEAPAGVALSRNLTRTQVTYRCGWQRAAHSDRSVTIPGTEGILNEC